MSTSAGSACSYTSKIAFSSYTPTNESEKIEMRRRKMPIGEPDADASRVPSPEAKRKTLNERASAAIYATVPLRRHWTGGWWERRGSGGATL